MEIIKEEVKIKQVFFSIQLKILINFFYIGNEKRGRMIRKRGKKGGK